MAAAVVALSASLHAQEVPPEESTPAPSVEPTPYSPRGAFFRSLLVPGWGQAYVGSPGRGAVYFTVAAGSFWMTYVARAQLKDAQREQDWRRSSGRIGETEETEFALARGRHFEDLAAFSLFLMFLSGADAYVSSYLADFDERIGVMPGPAGDVRLEARVPIGVSR